MSAEIPRGWHALRLDPDSDTRAVREYIERRYKGKKFRVLSRGEDREFVISEMKLDEEAIRNVARGDDPYDDSEMGKENEPSGPGMIQRSDTWYARTARGTSSLIRRVTFGKLGG